MTARKLLVAWVLAAVAPLAASGSTVGDVLYSVASPEAGVFAGYSTGLEWDGEYLWVSGGFSGNIYRFDPWTGTTVNQFSGPTNYLRDLAWDGSNLWVTSWDYPRTVYRLDPSTGWVTSSFSAPFAGHPDGLAWDGTNLWIGEEDGRIYRVDPLTGLSDFSLPAPYPFGSNPRGLAWDGHAIWAGYQGVGLIKQHDISSGSVLVAFGSPSGMFQQGLAWDGHYLWSTGGDNMIYQIFAGPEAPTTIPEPATFVLFGAGIAGLAVRSCRRRVKRK
jgi:hypothetical protein